MKTIAFFNNKGGVGKTTLAANVAAHLSKNLRQRVLLVDCDPQCNSTQLVLSEEECLQLYECDGKQQTIVDVLKPIQDGDAGIDPRPNPLLGTKNRFLIDVLPGHPRMSVVEDKLSQAWNEAIGGDIGGIRKTNWCYLYCRTVERRYDIAIFDVGPSLGSLNRTVLLGCDYFVTPMGCDIFSIVGVRNIGSWLGQWLELYDNSITLCDKRHSGSLEKFDLKREVAIRHGFCGYTVQQYVAKSAKGERLPTVAFDRILEKIPTEISRTLAPFGRFETADAVKLGDVPNMYSLIPLAQSAHSPILDLSGSDGLRGSGYSQASKYAGIIQQVATNLARNIGIEKGK